MTESVKSDIRLVSSSNTDEFVNKLSNVLLELLAEGYSTEVSYSHCLNGNQFHYSGVVVGTRRITNSPEDSDAD